MQITVGMGHCLSLSPKVGHTEGFASIASEEKQHKAELPLTAKAGMESQSS